MKKLIVKVILIVIFICTYSYAQYCDDVYHCKKQINQETLKLELSCTLSNKNATMPITALDVFEADGKTLKKYFETNNDVCDVLGWMNEGAKKFSAVGGGNFGFTKNIYKNLNRRS